MCVKLVIQYLSAVSDLSVLPERFKTRAAHFPIQRDGRTGMQRANLGKSGSEAASQLKSVQSALSDLLTTSATHGTFSRPSTKRGLISIIKLMQFTIVRFF